MPSNEMSFKRMATRSSPRRCVLERTAVSRRGSTSSVKTAKSCKDNQLNRSESESINTSVRHANRVLSRTKRSCTLGRSKISKQKGHISTSYFQCQLSDEVLLILFSFLPAKDICTLACVCQRFKKICKDSTLWEQLYKSTFGLDYPLQMNDQRLYEIIPRSALTKNSWREAFISFYHSYHVVCKESQKKCDHVKYHSSLEEAIKSVPENGIIIVHPGIYREELIIEKTVTIIGAGSEDKSEVTIEGSNATVVKFVSGSSTSCIRNVSIKYVGGNGASSRPSCIDIGSDCSATIHRCNVTSKASAGSTVYVHGKNARPLVINCSINDSENVGIFINNNAQGIYENNEISNNRLAGVWVKNGGNPIMRNNKVHHGRDVGFFIFDNGQGEYDGNDVFSNRKGFAITGGNPTVVRCKIHHSLTEGISVHDEGGGKFLDNKIYANTFAGVRVTSRNNPTVSKNEISDGKQAGVYVSGDGRSVIENNNIHSNAFAGIEIRSQSDPVVQHNKIHHGLQSGIYVHEGGLGLIKDNEIYSNTFAGIAVTTGSSPVMRNNRIHSGEQPSGIVVADRLETTLG